MKMGGECGLVVRGPQELRIMNSRLRKKTVKRVAPNEPKLRASSRPGMGKVKAREQGEGNRECGIRNAECGIGSESRTTNHDSRTPRTFSGRTKPFRRKTKAAIKTGRALPHVADGAARPGSRVLSSLGQASRLNNRSARNGVLANPKSAIRNPISCSAACRLYRAGCPC